MHRITFLAVCCFALAACENGMIPPSVEHQWQATLTGEAGWEHLSGSVIVQATGPGLGFVATAELIGDAPGEVRPWHVHFNTCAQGGGIVGQDGDYPRLQIGTAGTAAATVTIPQPLDPTASYHVNVHLSDANLATIIACGDLILD